MDDKTHARKPSLRSAMAAIAAATARKRVAWRAGRFLQSFGRTPLAALRSGERLPIGCGVRAWRPPHPVLQKLGRADSGVGVPLHPLTADGPPSVPLLPFREALSGRATPTRNSSWCWAEMPGMPPARRSSEVGSEIGASAVLLPSPTFRAGRTLIGRVRPALVDGARAARLCASETAGFKELGRGRLTGPSCLFPPRPNPRFQPPFLPKLPDRRLGAIPSRLLRLRSGRQWLSGEARVMNRLSGSLSHELLP